MKSMLSLVAGFPWASNVSCLVELPGPPGRMMSPSQFTVSTNCVPAGTGPLTTLRIVRVGWLPPSTPAVAGSAGSATSAAATSRTPVQIRIGPPRFAQSSLGTGGTLPARSQPAGTEPDAPGELVPEREGP